MAILINTALTKDGLDIPAGSMVKPNTHFPADEWVLDDTDQPTGEVLKRVTMDIVLYTSKADFQAYKNSIGSCDQLPAGYNKVLSVSDYSDLSGANAFLTVETWLKDYLETILGAGTCSIIDPYQV